MNYSTFEDPQGLYAQVNFPDTVGARITAHRLAAYLLERSAFAGIIKIELLPRVELFIVTRDSPRSSIELCKAYMTSHGDTLIPSDRTDQVEDQ